MGWLSELFFGHKPLTCERIAALPPRKLYREVFRNLPDADDANPAQWDFVCAAELDGEVRDGGFRQYLYNAGAHRDRAAEVLERMDAADAAAIVRRVNAVFDANCERLDALWRDGARDLAASRSEELFAGFDAEYLAVMTEERFLELLAGFVRARAGDFAREP